MVLPSTQFDRGNLRTASHLRLLRVQPASSAETRSRVVMDAISPEASGFVSLIGVFPENFVHQKRHLFPEVVARVDRVDV